LCLGPRRDDAVGRGGRCAAQNLRDVHTPGRRGVSQARPWCGVRGPRLAVSGTCRSRDSDWHRTRSCTCGPAGRFPAATRWWDRRCRFDRRPACSSQPNSPGVVRSRFPSGRCRPKPCGCSPGRSRTPPRCSYSGNHRWPGNTDANRSCRPWPDTAVQGPHRRRRRYPHRRRRRYPRRHRRRYPRRHRHRCTGARRRSPPYTPNRLRCSRMRTEGTRPRRCDTSVPGSLRGRAARPPRRRRDRRSKRPLAAWASPSSLLKGPGPRARRKIFVRFAFIKHEATCAPTPEIVSRPQPSRTCTLGCAPAADR
jgi:hypothetical protein